MLEAINAGSDVSAKDASSIRSLPLAVLQSPVLTNVSTHSLHQYIALRWSAKQLLGREVYKHLAPLEPDSGLLKLLS